MCVASGCDLCVVCQFQSENVPKLCIKNVVRPLLRCGCAVWLHPFVELWAPGGQIRGDKWRAKNVGPP